VAYRRTRGLGQAGIPPGNTCYDATHDPGEIHCANFGTVLSGAFLPGAADATTSCSASETACLATNPGAVGTDPCTSAIGIPCTTVFMYGAVAIVLVLIVFSMKK